MINKAQHWSIIRSLLSAYLMLLAGCSNLQPTPAHGGFADAHIHYNWDQKEIISAEKVTSILRQHHVDLAIVAGTPTELALEIERKQKVGQRIVPLFSPYTHELAKRDWYKNTQLAQQFETGLRQRYYFGLGEVHFMSGFPPRLDNAVFVALLKIAEKFRVSSLIHIDSADASLFLRLCHQYPRQKLIFAHAGGNLSAKDIRSVLQQCPKAWIDLSARDKWRYGGLVDKQGQLLQDWRKLMLEFPNKFVTGTDPVWRVTRTQSWDQADDGWDHYAQLLHFHQAWLRQLPEDVAAKIAWDNVLQAYSISQVEP